jgi:hypothetical protein
MPTEGRCTIVSHASEGSCVDQPDGLNEAQGAWSDYNDRQEFEHELLNRKITWLLTAQTILFAAYGVTFGSEGDGVETFRNVVAASGVSIAAIVFVSTVALLNSKRLSWKSYARFFGDPARQPPGPIKQLPGPLKNEPLQWGVDTRNTWVALLPDVMLPVVFIVAWCFLFR